jgi:hypothetical protein
MRRLDRTADLSASSPSITRAVQCALNFCSGSPERGMCREPRSPMLRPIDRKETYRRTGTVRQEQYNLDGALHHELFRFMMPAAFAMLIIVAPSKPAQVACQAWVAGNGQALEQPAANAQARSDWAVKVSETYGPAWAKFAQAQHGALPCNKAGAATWSCAVRAKPCMAALKVAQ